MSNLNKKIRKVQKGGAETVGSGIAGATNFLTSGLAPVGNSIDGLTESTTGSAKKIMGSAQFSKLGPKKFMDKLDEIAEGDQTEEKLNQLRTSMFADSTIWDLLYEEPCYVDPGTGHIVLGNIKKLWCNFQNDEIKNLLGLIIGDKKKTVTIADIKKCKEEFFKTRYGKSGDEIKEDISAHQNFDEIIEKLRNAGRDLPQDPSNTKPMGQTDYDNAMKKLEQICPDSFEEEEISNVANMNLVFDPPGSGDITQSKSSGSADNPGCPDMIKFAFCFIFKFLFGPGGFFVIKMLPHVIKFYYSVKNSFWRIFLGLVNTIKASTNMGTVRPYVYYGKLETFEKDGVTPKYGFRRDFYPNGWDTIFTYFGTVIPLNFVSYTLGQKYGKGEFGKLIVGLVVVSAVIIIIGGVGITILFLCFAFYCIKTLSMFSDNLKQKQNK